MNLNTHINFDPNLFLRWWVNQLKLAIPVRIQHSLLYPNGYILLRKTDNRIQYVHFSLREEITTASIEQKSRFLDTLDVRPPINDCLILFLLDEADYLVKDIALPIALKSDYANVISYELEKYLPFSRAEVAYETRIAFEQVDLLGVKLVAVPNYVLDRYLEMIEPFAIQPDFIGVAEVNQLPSLHQAINFIPAHAIPKRHPELKTYNVIANGLIALIGILIIFYPPVYEYQLSDALIRDFESIKKETQELQIKKQTANKMLSQLDSLVYKKQNEPSMLMILSELSKILGDDTSLLHYQMQDKKLQILGISREASSLIELIEDSPYFENVAFISPVIQDKVAGSERFEMSMNLKNIDAIALVK